MSGSWINIVGFLTMAACGSPATPAKAPDTAKATSSKAATSNSSVTNPDAASETATVTPTKPERPAPTPAPIAIPNGRLFEGYVVGGMPSKEQFDLAVDAGFDSAMSLMDNEEPGIRELAPYASSIGVRYLHFTIKDKSDLTEATAWEFASTIAMLGRPAIIHSARGERVGAIFALMAFFVDEASAEEALAIGAAAGMGSLEDHVRSLLVR